MSQNGLNTEFSWKRLILKTLILFLLCNVFFAWISPRLSIGKITLYNSVFEGRLRLPYGDDPSKSYNLTLNNLDAMFSSHIIAGNQKPVSEYRVVLIGDSATWGYLLANDHTLAGYLNQFQLNTPDGKHIVFYNLGYPVMSLTKDLLILSRALAYQPDLIIWLVTLESFPKDKQLYSPLIQANLRELSQLIQSHHLESWVDIPRVPPDNFWQRTLIAQRKPLADLIRFQLYGFAWSATRIDQDIPAEFPPRQEDLTNDLTFHDLKPPTLKDSNLSFSVLLAGKQLAGKIPIIFINEPIFISHGLNSDIRYNFYYPRWAYDDYRNLFSTKCLAFNWTCWDIWDLIPPNEFTNTAIHMTPTGSKLTAEWIADQLSNWLKTQP